MSRPYYLREPGWMPLYTLMIRSLILISVKLAIWSAFRNVRGFPFILIHAASWIVWLAIAARPLSSIAMESARNLRRYGISGFSRPRWWFEIARVFEVTFFTSVLSMPLFIFAPAGMIQMFRDVGAALSRSCDAAFLLWLPTFIIGCVLASIRHLPKSGRAFDCGPWLFWFTPATLMYLIAARLPPLGGFWWGRSLFWTICAIGLTSFLAAVGAVGKQLNRFRKSQRKMQRAEEKAQARLQRAAAKSR